jgi:ABC-2 type transport system permease protein
MRSLVKGHRLMHKSVERIKQMVIKEFIQILRDNRMKAIVFVVPVLQTLVFGFAVTTDVNNIPTAVVDLDNSFESRELVERFASSGYFSIVASPTTPGAVQNLLDRALVSVALQINRGFSADLKRRVPVSIQVIADGTDSNTATVAVDYAIRIIKKFSQDITPPDVRSLSRIDVRQRAWYNPELKSKNYNVPGVIAMVIMLTSLLLTSMATMEQLMVSPLKPVELILGKTIPFALIAFFDMIFITILGVAIFNIPINGPLWLLPLSTAIYLLSVLGIGLFVSTVSKTQQQALMATFLFYMPAILLSGFIFPIENMPVIFQYLTYANPLRYFLVIIRGIFLKGNGFGILWPHMLALFMLGAAVFTLSALRFKKRLG